MSQPWIGFNTPYITGKETEYIMEAVKTKKLSGDGLFTKRCQDFLNQRYAIKKSLLTTSCTDALELASLLIRIEPGDEVIMPGYTFVSTANAFVLRGAKIVFADSRSDEPGLDVSKIEELITPRTKAIVPVHYAGVAVDMDPLMELAKKYNLWVVEDAAQGIESFYKGKALGSIGHLGAYSFHETKNIHAGEGGAVLINHDDFLGRAEIIREKGTNRAAFFRGEVDKYGWVDVGSSFLPSEITAAFLWAQLEDLEGIQAMRLRVWNRYFDRLQELATNTGVSLPFIHDYATNNAHMFYLVTESGEQRNQLIDYLKKEHNIGAVFHYLPLQKSSYFKDLHDGRPLTQCQRYGDCLLRLPFFNTISEEAIDRVADSILSFFS